MTPSSPVLKNIIDLPEVTLAKHQPEYVPLPAIIGNDQNGIITTRWTLSWRERIRLLIHGDLWLQQMTFHRGFSPVKLTVTQPDITECL